MDGKSVVHIPSFAVTMNARAVMSLNVGFLKPPCVAASQPLLNTGDVLLEGTSSFGNVAPPQTSNGDSLLLYCHKLTYWYSPGRD